MGKVTPFQQPSTEAALTPPAPLEASHDLSKFDCGKSALNDWLRSRALKNEGKGARTYVVCSGKCVVGYYALASGHVERDRAPSNVSRNMPDPIPVFVLGRLAVDNGFQGKGVGSGLLKDAMKRALGAAQIIGARALIVHALDDEAVSFYLQYGFKPSPTDARTLFLPLSYIADAL